MIDFNIDYKDILDNTTDGVYITDPQRKILYWNKAAELITGFSGNEVVGKHCYEDILVHINGEGCSLCKGLCPLAFSLKDGTSRTGQVYLHHKEGYRKPVNVRIVPIKDNSGNVIAGVEFFSELPDEKAFNLRIQELEHLSFKDQLIGIPNRRYAEEQIKSKLSEFERLDIPFGLLFFDIDHFKKFNDNYGHEAGDKVLKIISKTLKSNSRPYDVYARWGGEEFVAIISGVNSTSLKVIAEKIRIMVKSSEITINGKMHSVTVSIGGTICTKKDTIDTIVKRADELMYQSKQKGRDCITI